MRSPSDFAAVRDFLFAQKAHGTKFGIDRMAALADALGHPERRTPAIHIAGTNGKGSVAALVESILRAAGWKTGLFTSPHLVHVGERVQVNRVPLGEAELVQYMTELRPIADAIAAADANLRPSFFEYMSAIAFLEFARQRCDLAVVEVGLGGRLDATNILVPEVSVITSIGLDHCEILGATLAQIAGEKAGIIKPGRPVVMGRVPPEAEARIREVAAARGAPLISVRAIYGDAIDRYPHCGLEGDYQRWNAATAVETVRALGAGWRVDDSVTAQGLRGVRWAGRWERRLVGGRTLILDASHNPAGADVLDANLARLERESGRRPIVVTCVLGLDRARPLLEAVARHAAEIQLVASSEPRACSVAELRACVPARYTGRVLAGQIETIFPHPGACTLGLPGDVIVVTGSIHLLGAVLARLGTGISSTASPRG
jgi:dihydrofolate synthase/folylpolyglutamate synthase